MARAPEHVRDGDFERPIPKLILSRAEGGEPPEIVIPPLAPDLDDPTEGEVE